MVPKVLKFRLPEDILEYKSVFSCPPAFFLIVGVMNFFSRYDKLVCQSGAFPHLRALIQPRIVVILGLIRFEDMSDRRL